MFCSAHRRNRVRGMRYRLDVDDLAVLAASTDVLYPCLSAFLSHIGLGGVRDDLSIGVSQPPAPIVLTVLVDLEVTLALLVGHGSKSSTAVAKRQLSGQGDYSRSVKSQAEAGEHCQVGVERDLLQAANPEWRQCILGLQSPELSFHGSTATVQVAESLATARDEWRLASSVRRDGWREPLGIWVVPHRNNRADAEVEALAVNPVVVVALVHGASLSAVTASAEGFDQGHNVKRLLPP